MSLIDFPQYRFSIANCSEHNSLDEGRNHYNKMLRIISIFAIISNVFANYNGPFLLWGREDLKSVDTSALQSIDDNLLRDIYSAAGAVIVFVKNASNQLTVENYPTFKESIDKSDWIYLPQHYLSSDPVDFNVNAEVIQLVGPESQQDIELSALYKDAVNMYGEGKVLGILASKANEHEIRKRQAEELQQTTTSASPTEEPIEEGYIYIADSKIRIQIINYYI